MIGIKQGKVRNPFVGIIFGVLTGLSIYGTLHTGEYLSLKRAFGEVITKELGAIDQAEKDELIDTYLQEQTGSKGFLGYLKYTAEQGIMIGEIGGEDSPTQLNETFTWIYWLIELAIIEAGVISLTYIMTKQPFCEKCQNWYGQKEDLGNVENESSEKFLQLINQDNFRDAGQLIKLTTKMNYPRLELHLQTCSQCKDSDLILRVNKAFLDQEGILQRKETLQGMISRSQEVQIRRNIPEEENNHHQPEN
ncbi:MAG TPA: hypothetical protein VK184_06795 [Nostocaceae cyanobacterium]|nr:hypothetical protein [Nostocaceae cyanobacterium]